MSTVRIRTKLKKRKTHGEEIVEAFDCDEFETTIKMDEMGYELGTVCIHKMSLGPEGHTATILNPRVYFPDC